MKIENIKNGIVRPEVKLIKPVANKTSPV